MEYSKTIKIANKCFTKDDVLKIAKTISDSVIETSKSPTYSIAFIDDSSIKGNELDLFDSSDLDRKLTKSISITYYSSTSSNDSVRVSLTCPDDYHSSKIEISSSDKNWYNAMISKLTEDLSTTRKQSKLSSILMNVTIVSFLCIAFATLFSFLSSSPIINILISNNINVSADLSGLIFVICSVFYYILLSIFLKKLSNSFPSIEFCFGPEFNNPNLKIKRVLHYILLTIVPSILLNLIDKLF